MLRRHFATFYWLHQQGIGTLTMKVFQHISSVRTSFLFQSGQNKTHLKNPRGGQKG